MKKTFSKKRKIEKEEISDLNIINNMEKLH